MTAVPNSILSRMLEAPRIDTSKIAYQPPQSPGVSFKPILPSVSQGFYVNILRVRAFGVLSRHRQTGPVHALALRGK